MQSSPLNSSPSQGNLSRVVSDSQITKSHLQKMTDNFISHLDELIHESNPKTQYEKVLVKRLKQTEQLTKLNEALLLQNKRLNAELKRIKEGHEKSRKPRLSQNPNLSGEMDVESSPSQKSEPSSQSMNQTGMINQEQKLAALNEVNQKLQHARGQDNYVNQCFLKLQNFMELVLDKLIKSRDLQKLDQKFINRDNQLSVTISKQKYQKLLNFYIETTSSNLPDKDGKQKQNSVNIKQFKPEQEKQNLEQIAQTLSAEELEEMFSKIANKAGKKREWQSYLSQRQSQAQKNWKIIKQISNSRDDLQTKANLQKNRQYIQQNETISSVNFQNSTAIDLSVRQAQNQIQEVLFTKIKKILQKLQFQQEEIDLFERFDQKRKNERLFDLDDFLNRFKDRQDLHIISKEFTNYFIKSINLFIMKIMEIFTQTPINPEEYPWLIRKLNEKSNKLRPSIYQALQNQCNQYLSQKNPLQNHHQRNKIKPIPNPTFDEKKELQNQFVKAVFEYRDVLDSSLFNCNKRIEIKF